MDPESGPDRSCVPQKWSWLFTRRTCSSLKRQRNALCFWHRLRLGKRTAPRTPGVRTPGESIFVRYDLAVAWRGRCQKCCTPCLQAAPSLQTELKPQRHPHRTGLMLRHCLRGVGLILPRPATPLQRDLRLYAAENPVSRPEQKGTG